MSWKQKYKVVGVKPGPVITPKHGTINLTREDIPLEKMDQLYAEGFPYIERIHSAEKKTKTDKESPDS